MTDGRVDLTITTGNSVGEVEKVTDSLRKAKAEIQSFGDFVEKSFSTNHINTFERAIDKVYSYTKTFVTTLGTLDAALYGAFNKLANELNRIQGFISIMSVSTQSISKALEQFEFLRQTAQTLGVSIDALTTNYGKLAAAIPNMNNKFDLTQRLFTGVAMAARTLHASTVDTQLMFYAVTQMASKGVVSMEELRRQLGERLPGAMEIAARALSTNTQDLEKAIRTGTVNSVKFLNYFADELIRTFADSSKIAANTVDAAMQRLHNVWVDFVKAVLDSGSAQAIVNVFEALREKISDPQLINIFAQAIGQIAQRIADFVSTLTAEDIYRGFKALEGGIQVIVTLTTQLVNLFQWMLNNAGPLGVLLGAVAGASKGAAAGAAVGSFIPGVGTAVGGAVGAVGGAVIGGTALGYGGYSIQTSPEDEGRRLKALDEARFAAMEQQRKDAQTYSYIISLLQSDAFQFTGENISQILKAYEERGIAVSQAFEMLKNIANDANRNNLQQKQAGALSIAKYGFAINAPGNLADAMGPGKDKKVKLTESQRYVESLQKEADALRVLTQREDEASTADKKRAKDLAALNHFIETGELKTMDQVAAFIAQIDTTDELRQKNEELIETEKQKVATSKEILKAAEERAKAEEKLVEASLKKIAGTREDIQDSKIKTEEYKRQAQGIELLKSEVIGLQATKMEFMADTMDEPGANEALAASYREQAKALREYQDQLLEEESWQKQAEVTKSIYKAWTDLGQDISEALTDSLMRGFENGKGFLDSLVDAIKNSFKTLAVRLIIQPIMGQITGSLLQGLGAPRAAVNAITGDSSSLLSGSSGFLGSIGTLGAGLSSGLGATLSNGLIAGFGTNMANIGTAFMGSFGAGGTGLAGLSASAGMALPYLAAAYAAYRVFSGKGTGRDRAPAIGYQGMGSIGAGGFDLLPYDASYMGNPGGGSSTSEMAQQYVTAAGNMMLAAAKSLGGSISGITIGARYATSEDMSESAGLQVYGSSGKTLLDINASGSLEGIEGIQTWLADNMPKAILAGLQEADIDQRFKDYFATIDLESATKEQVDAALKAATSVATFTESMTAFGGITDEVAKQLAVFKTMSVEDVLDFGELFGGLDKAESSIGAYFDAFYTETEKFGMMTKSVQASLAELGYAGIDTREEFRGIVEALDLTKEADREVYASLMKLAPAFAAVYPAMDDTADSADKVTKAMRSAADIANEREGLERKLLELSGDTAAIRALELEKLDESNQALQQRIWTLEDEQRIASERAGLEQRLLQLTGDVAAIRALELQKLDESNRALQQRVWDLEDEQRVTNERLGLEQQLLQLTGDVNALRELELEKLDESNRALQVRIWSLQDEQAAMADLLRQTGITADGLSDVIAQGLLGKASSEDVGGQLATIVTDGLRNALVGNLASGIAKMFIDTIINPIIKAVIAGETLSNVVSQASIDAVIKKANDALTILDAVLNDPAWVTLLDRINTTLTGIGNAVTKSGTTTNTGSNDSTGYPGVDLGGGVTWYGPTWGGGSAVGNSTEESRLQEQVDYWDSRLTNLGYQRTNLDASSEDYAGMLELINNQITDATDRLADAQKQLDDFRAGGGGGTTDSDLQNLVNQGRQLEIDLLRAQGKDLEAVTKQRELDIAGMSAAAIAQYDANAKLIEQIEELNITNNLNNQTKSLEIDLLRAQGKDEEALIALRALETEGMTEAQIAIWNYNQSLRDQIKEATTTENLNNQLKQAEIAKMEALGNASGVLALRREIETEGMTAAQIATWNRIQALNAEVQALQVTKSLQTEHSNLEIELLRARGEEEAALAKERELAIVGMTTEQIAIYDMNAALREQIDATNAAAAAARTYASTQQALQVQYWELTGNIQAIRDLRLAELLVIDPTGGLGDLQESVWTLQDAASSTSEAIRTVVDVAKDALDKILSTTDDQLFGSGLNAWKNILNRSAYESVEILERALGNAFDWLDDTNNFASSYDQRLARQQMAASLWQTVNPQDEEREHRRGQQHHNARVEAALDTQTQQNTQIAITLQQLVKTHRRWDADGMPETRVV